MSRRVTRSQKIRVASLKIKESLNVETSDDSSDDSDGMLDILKLLFGIKGSVKKRKQKPNSGASKRHAACSDLDDEDWESHCGCANRSRSYSRRQSTGPTKRAKRKWNQPSTSSTVELVSDDEDPVSIQESKVNSMQTKVNDFFKTLESSDEELELNVNKKQKPAPQKDKDFYVLPSDSEEDVQYSKLTVEKPSDVNIPSTPSTSETISSEQSKANDGIGLKEDPFSIVDDIINYVDDTDPLPVSTTEPSIDSYEECKKKTDEIIESVSSLIKDFNKDSKKEEVLPETPKKIVSSCPICLENLSSATQIMATFCGHMFCKECITKVARISKKCPTCRQGVTLKKIHPVYI